MRPDPGRLSLWVRDQHGLLAHVTLRRSPQPPDRRLHRIQGPVRRPGSKRENRDVSAAVKKPAKASLRRRHTRNGQGTHHLRTFLGQNSSPVHLRRPSGSETASSTRPVRCPANRGLKGHKLSKSCPFRDRDRGGGCGNHGTNLPCKVCINEPQMHNDALKGGTRPPHQESTHAPTQGTKGI